MFKLMGALTLLLSFMSMDIQAADNLTLTKYNNSADIPATLLKLGGGAKMVGRTYLDDKGKLRSDKVYWTTTHSYLSSFKATDIARLLQPSNGRLDTLFEETTVVKTAKADVYNVMMKISTPIKDFDCSNTLDFDQYKLGNKSIFIYKFSNFNMVFTDMVIQVEIEESDTGAMVKLYQIAAVKSSTVSKLKTFLAVGKFEKALKENIKKFKLGVGGK